MYLFSNALASADRADIASRLARGRRLRARRGAGLQKVLDTVREVSEEQGVRSYCDDGRLQIVA